MLDEYAAGATFAELSERHGLSLDAIRARFRAWGVEARPAVYPPEPAVIDADILWEVFSQGHSVRSAAAALDVGHGVLDAEARKHGLSPLRWPHDQLAKHGITGDELLALRASGRTWAAVGALLGCGPKAAAGWYEQLVEQGTAPADTDPSMAERVEAAHRVIRRAAEEIGEPPTVPAFNDWAKTRGEKTAQTLMRRTGRESWPATLRDAGLDPADRAQHQHRWSTEQIHAALRACRGAIGRTPTVDDYRHWRANQAKPSPAPTTVAARHHNSWTEAVKAAG
ncbi:MAG TPA: hypothetical protein VMW94_06950 [Actinomycetes bacterium]|nr:hypothetical protein [Actinomycetes bacterium]